VDGTVFFRAKAGGRKYIGIETAPAPAPAPAPAE
jgi:hypothetical protein